MFRFDSHLLAEHLKESERLIYTLKKFRSVRIVSDKTTNQRLTQKCPSNENNAVEITTDTVASAAAPTDLANLSHVIQYMDLPMKSVNLPLMLVVTLGNQCIANGDINLIFSSNPRFTVYYIDSLNKLSGKILFLV